MHVVLDLDGTLSGDDEEDETVVPPLRPHVREFMKGVFDNFESVSLFSLGGEDHVKRMAQLLLPQECGVASHQWLFVKFAGATPLKSSNPFHDDSGGDQRKKCLTKLWRTNKCKQVNMTRRNTVMVDNTPSVCRDNRGNAIYVNTFHGHETEDEELPLLLRYLLHLQMVLAENPSLSIQSINKFHWRDESRQLPPSSLFVASS